MRPLAFILRWMVFLFAACGSGEAAAAIPYSGLVVDLDNERVLYERNADELRHPASLTKMMTLYLVFEALTHGDLFLDTRFRASRFAVLRPPSRLGLAAGDTLSVENAILALVTRSANDAATVIAESMAGSEAVFAQLMTEKARQLGMSRTVFRNASGLPDPNQVTTAWDMYRLGRALNKNFPEFYGYFSTPSFDYDGHVFQNHNHLLETYPGTDGIKTGFINASGFNLVASALRDGRRLIGVVFGGPSAKRRDAHMREILDDGFAQLDGAPQQVFTAEFERREAPVALARAQAEDQELEPASERRPAKKSRRPAAMPARHLVTSKPVEHRRPAAPTAAKPARRKPSQASTRKASPAPGKKYQVAATSHGQASGRKAR